MKKIMMIAAMMVAAVSANAQVYVGGGIGFQTTSQGDNTNTVIKIMPEIGYNLSENWAVGIALGYGHSKNTVSANGVDVSVKTDVFSINPYARYTFVKSGNFSAFVDGGVAYSTIHINGTSDVLGNINQVKVGFNPGVAYAISPKVGLVAHLGDLSYESTWCKAKNVDVKVSEGKFNIGLWNSISFGAYYNF